MSSSPSRTRSAASLSTSGITHLTATLASTTRSPIAVLPLPLRITACGHER